MVIACDLRLLQGMYTFKLMQDKNTQFGGFIYGEEKGTYTG